MLGAGLGKRGLIPGGDERFFLSKMQTPALGHTQFCYQWLTYHIHVKLSKTRNSSGLFCILDKIDSRRHRLPQYLHFRTCCASWMLCKSELNIRRSIIYLYKRDSFGIRLRGLLRNCATSLQIAGSIPGGIIWILQWLNPSDRTMALGSTQPLTEMSTRFISPGGTVGWCLGLITLPNLWTSASCSPKGMPRPL